MMWLLSWAILALVIVYSPIGSPDLYTNNQYIVYNQGVNFNGGIANAPKSHSYGEQNDLPEVGLPTYTPAPKTYTVNSSASSSTVTNNQSSYSVSAPSNIRTSTSGSSAGGAVTGIATFGSGRSSQNNAIDQNTGVSSLTLSSDLSGLQNTAVTTKQAASQTTLDGGTDPGGDPTGPPIPVGDGYWILMLMAGIYILKIRIIRMKKSTNFTN